MTMNRRDLLKFAAGGAVGALCTPAPWRLVTDTALWSETWPGVPRPARGEIRARYTNCSLCSAGCAVRARCVGDQPVSLAGVAEHPFSRGALCPFGIAGHHLPYHPARVRRGPVREASAAVAAGMARCAPSEHVAVLDLRPGRTASWTYRRAMARIAHGIYLSAESPWSRRTAVNLDEARTVLSFGVPLLDGWGTPGNVLHAREHFLLIQAEPVESRTAALADRWLAVRQGGEAALARALAAEIAGQSSAAAAPETGLDPREIAETARELKENGPAVVLDLANRPETLALNRALDSLGSVLVARREAPVPDAWKDAAEPRALASLPDRSVRVLLIDESAPGEYIPWSAIERVLVADDPVVVAFGWSGEGYARHARFFLPSAVYPEVLDDIPEPVDSPVALFRLSPPLVPAPAGVVHPTEFIASLGSVAADGALHERADAIHRAGAGYLFTSAEGKLVPLKDFKAEEFWKALQEGATWVDAPPPRAAAPAIEAAAAASFPVEDDLPLAVVLAETCGEPRLPILSKLYQESNLRLAEHRVVLHPASAAACGVEEGGKAVLQTRCGRLPVEIALDGAMPPGVVLVAAEAVALDVCGASPRAKVVRV